jgi:hypothetical protein
MCESFDDCESSDLVEDGDPYEDDADLEDCDDPDEYAALLEETRKGGPPYYFLNDVRGFGGAEGVRARAEGLRILKGTSPKQYERIGNDLEKRGVMQRAELDALVEARHQEIINKARRERLEAEERERIDEAYRREQLAAEASVAQAPKVLYLDQLDTLPEPRDFVEGLLCDGQVSVIFGDTNIGKTYLAIDLGMHVALGRSWQGRDVERGGVVYVAAEGGGGIKRRIRAFQQHHGIRPADAAFAVITETINFRDDKSVDGLIRLVPEIAKRLGVPVRLIILDTVSRALAGGNENAPDDMGALVRNIDRVRAQTRAHVTGIHHSGKDDSRGARGHSLLKAAIDTEIKIERPDGPHGVIEARVTKQRDLEIAGVISFKLLQVELGTDRRGKTITSCVVETVAWRPSLTETEQDATEILKQMLFEAPETTVPIAEWRKAVMSRQDVLPGQNGDTRKKQWQRMLASLKKKGVIVTYGENVELRNR